MRTLTNPAFYSDELRMLLGEEPERLARVLHDPDSIELLTWNLFASLDTHRDRRYLAYRFQAFGGGSVREPVRLSLWSGRHREPLLRPSARYVATIRERARAAGGDDSSTQSLEAPLEAPVRAETPDVLILVEPMLHAYPRGSGGRDRLVELIDAGLEQARRLSKTLAVTAVYPSGTDVAAQASARMQHLRDPATLAEELGGRDRVPPIILREIPWQQLIRMWEQEREHMRLGGEPVRAFLDHARDRGLR